MRNLFVYGSLMDRGVLEDVLGRPYEGIFEDATIRDHTRLDLGCYMLFKEKGCSCNGKLISGLHPLDFVRLDRFEGVRAGLYRRKTTTVDVFRGNKVIKVEADVYYNGTQFEWEGFER
jgi:gamma-glutamylcyclotransferase (GGCT)/AIG2-like uncharacterized protein YtfP